MKLAERIALIQHKIQQASLPTHFTHPITLIAVSKGHSPDLIREAYQYGLHDFGENYLQEALKKMACLSDLPLSWHFIGPIQSNKAESIAQHFDWVHTVSHSKIAHLLHKARSSHIMPLNVCIQVNIDEEQQKAGVKANEVLALAEEIRNLHHLHLRGLMMIPKQSIVQESLYSSFLKLHQLFQQINKALQMQMDTLSMGMSHDFETAIQAGSTMVRIGQAIFGERL